jgi:uncharacterized protein YndB with AHSA1/START domain
MKKMFQTGTIKKTITINAPKEKVWLKLSNIVGLSSWVLDVKKTTYLSKKRRGVGAVRRITFESGNVIEEHVIDWKNGEYFTYIATEGLPLRAYVATISIKPKNKKSVQITWQSYLNSNKMSTKQFSELLVDMRTFYQISLENLKMALER